MSIDLKDSVLLVAPHDPLSHVVAEMGRKSPKMFEIALVVDQDFRLQGVINYPDVLRALAAGQPLDAQSHKFMSSTPIVAPYGASDGTILDTVREQVRARTGGSKQLTRFVPLVDDSGIVHSVVDVFAMLARSPGRGERVDIYGLGFVGLTLAVALASKGHSVTGFDKDKHLVERLNRGEYHVHEPRLGDMMHQSMIDGSLEFRVSPGDRHARVVIVAVGTPVDCDGVVLLDGLESVVESIGSRLQRGDLVMLRSTVPVGTTRSLVRQGLEKLSGLEAGVDFALAFTPERTAEGQAIQELSTLPQIVGGLTESCSERATSFWQTLTPSVVRVEGLEAAELVKLANNSYRDHSFAFANAFALLSDSFNLDAKRILAAANDGYPRDRIPLPSPGVGGYCLTKDPFLYATVADNQGHGSLARLGREVNSRAGTYPLKVLDRFAQRIGRKVQDLSVFIVGLAFKGQPETNDVRGSVAVQVGQALLDLGSRVSAFDAVLSGDEVKNLGFIFEDPDLGSSTCDALLILNNHPSNIRDGMVAKMSGRQTLLFDGWSLLESSQVERYEGIMYANMGYSTPLIGLVS